MKVTYGDNSNKKVLKLDGVDSIKAANGEGEAIIAELHKFGNNQSSVFQPELMYMVEQKAWINTRKNKFVLFNIAESKDDQVKTIDFVKNYTQQTESQESKNVSNVTGAVITTDFGVVVSTDKDSALQTHTSGEKNTPKK